MMMRDEAFLLQKVKDLKISPTHNIHLTHAPYWWLLLVSRVDTKLGTALIQTEVDTFWRKMGELIELTAVKAINLSGYVEL